MFDLNKFIDEVHTNSVAHGFWEGERDICESIALIHAEWSEALEEYRADRPMVWTACEAPIEVGSVCPRMELKGICANECCTFSDVGYKHPKPEGIAIELIDGCIRILDLFGKYERSVEGGSIEGMARYAAINNPQLDGSTPVPKLVAGLHSITARALDRALTIGSTRRGIAPLVGALGVVFHWLIENGYDPEKLMLAKHEYNKTRPYKHGKKC